jgi:hypothetical protein
MRVRYPSQCKTMVNAARDLMKDARRDAAGKDKKMTGKAAKQRRRLLARTRESTPDKQ